MTTGSLDRKLCLLGGQLFGVSDCRIYRVLPGIALAAALAWLSVRLSTLIGVDLMGFTKSPISPVMIAILLGLIVANVVRLPAWTKDGITFAVKKVLRLGIILLGIRLSVFGVLQLGALGVPIVLLTIGSALFITTYVVSPLYKVKSSC